ncbi:MULTISPECIES: bacteriohemerythrin [unclassified Oceanispirochaeta]|uniref:bacteriohemerythrin n=1 Tax=unclassified Oceanispirochaeta TaxID=2635722 RepID=UPI000E098016|nr:MULTISPECIES: hemerythrin domain-containing protein [unclassified Oceanispirochaeta]MBF9017464.1 hypothetical protein [Oceanispirochaeta sp. M2]NPD74036.1 hypothetical protein [Oceanispirochaeta sp. M1]RDG30203.1 hypothetical protein DV872_18220 [Oceanispirochaeta sp. M1]
MNFDWHDQYKTNIPELDIQHKKVLDLIKKLQCTDDYLTEKALLKEILNYSVFHFISETELLQAYSYPHLNIQKKYQQDFIDQLSVSIGLFSAGNLFKENILYSLSRWFEKHTTCENKGFDSYIRSLIPV